MSWLQNEHYQVVANAPSPKERSDDLPPDMKPSEWLARLAAGKPVGSGRADRGAGPALMAGPTGSRTGMRKATRPDGMGSSS